MISKRKLCTGVLSGLIMAPMVVKAASLMPLRGIVMPIELKWRRSNVHCGAYLTGKECELNIIDRVRLEAAKIILEMGYGTSDQRQFHENMMVERTLWVPDMDTTRNEMVRYLDEVSRQGWGYVVIPERFEPARSKNRSVRQSIKEALVEVRMGS